MRYPVDEESDSNELWDLPFDEAHEAGLQFLGRTLPNNFYDSTLSEYTPPDSNSDERLSSEVNVMGHPTRPRTPQPSNTGTPDSHHHVDPLVPLVGTMAELDLARTEPTSSRRIGMNDHPEDEHSYSNEFIPTISINVPSRRTHRRLNRRTRNSTWYGTSSLSQNTPTSVFSAALADPDRVSAFTAPPRVSRYRDREAEAGYPQRVRSPSRIPTLLMSNDWGNELNEQVDLFNARSNVLNERANPTDYGISRQELFNARNRSNELFNARNRSNESNQGNESANSTDYGIAREDLFNARSPTIDFSNLNENTAEVSRFIHPTFAMLASIHSDGNLGRPVTTATQTDSPPYEDEAPPQSDPGSALSDIELEFDDSHEFIVAEPNNLRDILSFNRPSDALDRDSPLSHHLQDSIVSDGRLSADLSSTSSNISLLSCLSRKSRTLETNVVAYSDSSTSEEEDTSTPTRNDNLSHSKEEDRSTPTLELTTDPGTEEVAGPSNCAQLCGDHDPTQPKEMQLKIFVNGAQTTELQAEIVVNNDATPTTELQPSGDATPTTEPSGSYRDPTQTTGDRDRTHSQTTELQLSQTTDPTYSQTTELQHSQTTELQAEIVVNDVVFQHGRCSITFASLHADDLTQLLSQEVSVRLEKSRDVTSTTHVLRLNITPAPSLPEARPDSPRSIYRPISRYMGGSVMPGHVKRVSFSGETTRDVTMTTRDVTMTTHVKGVSFSGEEETEEDETSSHAVEVEWSDNENDIISEVEEFELD